MARSTVSRLGTWNDERKNLTLVGLMARQNIEAVLQRTEWSRLPGQSLSDANSARSSTRLEQFRSSRTSTLGRRVKSGLVSISIDAPTASQRGVAIANDRSSMLFRLSPTAASTSSPKTMAMLRVSRPSTR